MWRPPRAHRALPTLRAALREPAVLAVSGGADSTGLALLAATCGVAFGSLPLVVWVNHGVRAGAEREGDVVAQTAAHLGLPFVPVLLDDAAQPAGASLEAWLRERRMTALARVALAHQRSVILTGHTRDDQVETVLMRLLAGPAGHGWHGMAASRPQHTPDGNVQVLHPLLDIARTELRGWVQQAGLTTIEDPSNADTTLLRNRIRHDVMPVLERAVPGWQATLLRAASQAATDAALVDTLAEQSTGAVVHVDADGAVTLHVDALRALPSVIAQRVARAAVMPLVAASGHDLRDLSTERIDALLHLLHADVGKVVQLPGRVTAQRTREQIVVRASTVADRHD